MQASNLAHDDLYYIIYRTSLNRQVRSWTKPAESTAHVKHEEQAGKDEMCKHLLERNTTSVGQRGHVPWRYIIWYTKKFDRQCDFLVATTVAAHRTTLGSKHLLFLFSVRHLLHYIAVYLPYPHGPTYTLSDQGCLWRNMMLRSHLVAQFLPCS